MTFIRTVLGDIAPSELGITYSHEHLAIAAGRMTERSPDFRLDDPARAVDELAPAQALGLRSVVDAMPCDAGRDAELLAEISRRSGIHVIASTGAHAERHYPERHWTLRLPIDEMAGLFAADIDVGIDALDYGAPVVRRTPHRAGVIKVAGSAATLGERDRRVFEAAALASRATGCPILTHCEGGRGGTEQVAWLTRHGARAEHIALSHVDKVVDRGYQRELWETGACVEYDGAFRWADQPNGTLQLLEWAAEDGHLGQVVLGLDAARQGYWTAYGGSPGWAFLLDGFTRRMAERGLGDRERWEMFVANPARLYAFSEVHR